MRQIKIITVSFDPESGEFDDSELREFLAQTSDSEIHEGFFVHAKRPYWTFAVSYTQSVSIQARTPKDGKTNYRNLMDAQKARYHKLRLWRNARASTDGVPPYLILTNRNGAMNTSANGCSRRGP